MSLTKRMTFAVVLPLAVALANVTHAQGRKAGPGAFSDSPWWVIKLSTDATDNSVEVVDGARTEAEAGEKAEQWRRRSKFEDPFFYTTKKNPAYGEDAPREPDQEAVRRPGPSAPPKLPSVDPGEYLSSKPNYPADDPRGTEGAYNNPFKSDPPKSNARQNPSPPAASSPKPRAAGPSPRPSPPANVRPSPDSTSRKGKTASPPEDSQEDQDREFTRQWEEQTRRLEEETRRKIAEIDAEEEEMRRSDAERFHPGDGALVEWGNRWWDATVLEVDDGSYYIHYVGWGDEWDEWVGPDRIE